MRPQKGSGSKRLISKEIEKMVSKAVDEMQKNRCGGRIRGRDIWEMVNKKYGINLSNVGLYRLLHRAGFLGLQEDPNILKLTWNGKKILKKL